MRVIKVTPCKEALKETLDHRPLCSHTTANTEEEWQLLTSSQALLQWTLPYSAFPSCRQHQRPQVRDSGLSHSTPSSTSTFQNVWWTRLNQSPQTLCLGYMDLPEQLTALWSALGTHCFVTKDSKKETVKGIMSFQTRRSKNLWVLSFWVCVDTFLRSLIVSLFLRHSFSKGMGRD